MEQARIIKALKDIGHNVDESKFSERMKSPEFVERVRKTLVDEGHNVSDSTNFYDKYSTKPVPVKSLEQTKPQENQGVMSQIGDGIRTGLETAFPRVTSKIQSDEGTELKWYGLGNELKSAGERLVDYGVPGLLDAASFPGRLATGLFQGTTNSGMPDGRKFQESVARIESENPGVMGFVEDIARSPFNVIPGVGGLASKGAAGVTTKIAPELLPKIASVIPKGKYLTPLASGLGQVARGAGTAADIGITQNIADGKDLTDNLANNMIPGLVLGSVPGIYKYAKGRNTEKIVEGMLPKLEAMGANIPKNRPENLLAGLDQMAKEIGVKLPADQISKIEAIPKFLQDYNSKMGTKYKSEGGIFSEALKGITIPNQNYGPVDLLDLASLGAFIHPSSPSMSIGALYPAGKLLEKKTPLVEKTLAPLADKLSPIQNLGRGIMGSYISR